MRFRGGWFAGAFVVTFSSACSRQDEAREQFVEDVTCPAPQIQSRPRPDIDLYDLIHRNDAAEKPSPEIAADPARLALWKKQRAEATADARQSKNKMYALYEVQGCGHTILYECWMGSRSNGDGGPCRKATGDDAKYPPGNPPW